MLCPVKNEGVIDRIIRAILGVGAGVGAIFTSGALQIVLGIIAALLIITSITGITGVCLLYIPLGINTNKKSN
jgi:hypothetical protein